MHVIRQPNPLGPVSKVIRIARKLTFRDGRYFWETSGGVIHPLKINKGFCSMCCIYYRDSPNILIFQFGLRYMADRALGRNPLIFVEWFKLSFYRKNIRLFSHYLFSF